MAGFYFWNTFFFFHLWVPYCFCLVFSIFTPHPHACHLVRSQAAAGSLSHRRMKSKKQGKYEPFPVVLLCEVQALLCSMLELKGFKFRIHYDRTLPNLLSPLSKQYVLLSGRCLLSEKASISDPICFCKIKKIYIYIRIYP